MTNQTATTTSRTGKPLYECREPGCWTFPFDSELERTAHEVAGVHNYEADFKAGSTVVAFEHPLAARGNGGPGTGTPYTPDPRVVEATEFARTYNGTFEFMLEMKAKALKPVFRPSPKMVDAILRCKAAQRPVTAPAAAPAPVAHRYAGMTWQQVMEANEYFDGEQELTEQARRQWEAANATPPAFSANRFGGPCVNCRHEVAPEAGYRDNRDGKWVVFHKDGECNVTPAVEAPVVEARVGVYFLGEQMVAVRKSRGSDRLYAKSFDGHEWVYVPGLIRRFGEFREITAAEAAAYGHQHEHCVFCSRSLSDDGPKRSMEVGYGPVCADKYGLPWGA